METKSLLYGLIGFFLGGLIVSIAATYLNPPQNTDHSMSDGMQASIVKLEEKTGDSFDSAYINEMIQHHQGAIDMARVAERNAKHEEIKQLSKDIISAQESEINLMRQWQTEWGYVNSNTMNHSGHSM